MSLPAWTRECPIRGHRGLFTHVDRLAHVCHRGRVPEPPSAGDDAAAGETR